MTSTEPVHAREDGVNAQSPLGVRLWVIFIFFLILTLLFKWAPDVCSFHREHNARPSWSPSPVSGL